MKLPEVSNKERDIRAAADRRGGFDTGRGARCVTISSIEFVHAPAAPAGDLHTGRLRLRKQGRVWAPNADRPADPCADESDDGTGRGMSQLEAFGRAGTGSAGAADRDDQEEKSREHVTTHVNSSLHRFAVNGQEPPMAWFVTAIGSVMRRRLREDRQSFSAEAGQEYPLLST